MFNVIEPTSVCAQALYPPFSVGLSPSGGVQSATTSRASEPAVSEVHLRRLDRPDMLHRRAVSLISINATPDEVIYNLQSHDSVQSRFTSDTRADVMSGMSLYVTSIFLIVFFII